MKKNKKANYGQEMAGLLIVLTALSVIMTFAAFWLTVSGTLSVILIVMSAIFLFLVITGVWSSRIGKLKLRDRIFKILGLKGNESVLDIGCGRGLLLITAAKQLPGGKAVGADHWKGTMEYRYTSQMVLENAVIEGVQDHIEILNADAQALPFADETYDVVMTSLMMHHVKDPLLAIKEMARVLKPGGTLILADVGVHRFGKALKNAGIAGIQQERAVRLFFMPVGILCGKKTVPLQQ